MRKPPIVALLLLALVASGCSTRDLGVDLGGERGEHESLEAELAAIREGTMAVIAASLGEVEIIGENVSIFTCDPDPRHSGGVGIVLRDDELPPEEARSRVLAWLRETNTPLDSDRPDITGRPVRFTPDAAGLQVYMLISVGRVPGLEFGGGTGCYGDSRIEADDPFSLTFQTGESLFFF